MLGGEGCGRPREPPASRLLPSFCPSADVHRCALMAPLPLPSAPGGVFVGNICLLSWAGAPESWAGGRRSGSCNVVDVLAVAGVNDGAVSALAAADISFLRASAAARSARRWRSAYKPFWRSSTSSATARADTDNPGRIPAAAPNGVRTISVHDAQVLLQRREGYTWGVEQQHPRLESAHSVLQLGGHINRPHIWQKCGKPGSAPPSHCRLHACDLRGGSWVAVRVKLCLLRWHFCRRPSPRATQAVKLATCSSTCAVYWLSVTAIAGSLKAAALLEICTVLPIPA